MKSGLHPLQLSYLVIVAGAAVALGVVPHLNAGHLGLKEEQRPGKKFNVF